MPQLVRSQVAIFIAAAVVLGTAACGDNTGPSAAPKGLANCGGTPMLTVSPVDISIIRDLTPLGNLNPPGHTLPTDHLYFFAFFDVTTAELIPVVSPGDVVVSEVTRQTRLSGAPSVIEYSMTFFPCADLSLYFAHVVITPELLAEIGPFGTCNQYVAGGDTYESCAKRLNLKLKAGALVGSMGGSNGNALDFGGYDRRVTQLPFVNQARSYGYGTEFGQNRTICPVDYFVASVASGLRAKFGTSSKRRTIEPLCGTVMQDLPNTAQGRWYFNETTQDDPHLALAHDNTDPRIGVISVGTSVPSLPPRYWGFTPAASGRVNADFSRVTADGMTYCYQSFLNATSPIRHVLIQLVSATRVRIEGFTGVLCGDESTWAFTAGAREFAR
ncbi:MAG: hypothetical protein ACRENH_13745 [Gemmatimonadaceae bacterium]